MKPVAEWTEADLHQLIADGIEESLKLEYKRSAALDKSSACITELSKDVSAFANSAGGRIVYGIAEVDHKPSAIDAGSDPAAITREWIEQILNSHIQPRVQGVTIKPIELQSGRRCYVIDIPQASTFAPHQATDKKYYRRFNFLSVPMEDYEIKDAMRRSQTGHPIAYFQWEKHPEDDNFVRWKVALTNRSVEPILYMQFQIFIDERLVTEETKFPEYSVERNRNVQWRDVQLMNVAKLRRNIAPPAHMPIFREQAWTMIDLQLPLAPEDDYYVGYTATCPGNRIAVLGSVHISGFDVSSDDPLMAELFAFPKELN